MTTLEESLNQGILNGNSNLISFDFRMLNCQSLFQKILDRYWNYCCKETSIKDWVVKEMGKLVCSVGIDK